MALPLVTKIRLLPLFMFVAAIALTVRFGALVDDVAAIIPTAKAQEDQIETRTETETGQEADASVPADEGFGVGPVERQDDAVEQLTNDLPDNDAILFTDPSLMTRSEIDLLQDLAARRSELDAREEQLEIREQLLASTEQRIDRRIGELQALQQRIEGLVVEHEEQEDEQLRSIVRVYESMKAKDSAPIFERLDMPIQVAVATRMKENKVAEMLAEMNPDAAKTLTTTLAQRAQLPEIQGLEEARATLP